MVKSILRYFNKEINGLHEAAYLLAIFAFLSQVLALVREKLLAYTFGATHALDLYNASFRVPDIVFVSIASLVSVSVLVPFLTEKLEQGKDETKRFVNGIFSVFFALVVVVVVILFFTLPYILPHVFPGFNNPETLPELVKLTRIMLLSPFLLGISNFFASITQIHNRFTLYALSPLVYNFGIIIGILVFYPLWGIPGLVWGVVLGAFFHCGIQAPFIIKQGYWPKISFKIPAASVRKVMLVSVPRTLAISLSQISTFFLLAIASTMREGSISIYNFASNLQAVPLTIVGISYSSAAFPLLAKYFSSGARDKFLERMIITAKHIIFWSIPIMVLLVSLRAQIVRTVLGAGEFTWTDTRLTAACLALFTISIVCQSLVMLCVRAFYASGRTRRPLMLNLLATGVIIVVAYFLQWLFSVWPVTHYFLESTLRVPDIEGTEVLILPLAFSIGTIFNCITHWIDFSRENKGFTKAVWPTIFQSLSASILMGTAVHFLLDIFDDIFDINTGLGIFLQGFCAGIIGLGICVVLLWLLRSPELGDVWKTLHKKVWKTGQKQVIVPEQEQL